MSELHTMVRAPAPHVVHYLLPLSHPAFGPYRAVLRHHAELRQLVIGCNAISPTTRSLFLSRLDCASFAADTLAYHAGNPRQAPRRAPPSPWRAILPPAVAVVLTFILCAATMLRP